MAEKRAVRIIKRDQRNRAEPAASSPPAPPGRLAREVVSNWVREHRRRAEEFRHNYAELLAEVGLGLPRRMGG